MGHHRTARPHCGIGRAHAVYSVFIACGLIACTPKVSEPGHMAPAPTDRAVLESIPRIVQARCAPCHRPDGVAPFALLEAKDFRKRAKQVLRLIESDRMPPWPPDSGYGAFLNDRSLESEERAMLLDWLQNDCPESSFSEPISDPTSPETWALGTPDLRVRPDQSYSLAAEGPDQFRNLVIPNPVEETVYVRAFDFRPNAPAAVHHMILELDHTDSSRELAQADPEAGFDGMEIGSSTNPVGGQFFGWSPGREPAPVLPGMAWRLDPGADIVLRLHLLPTGKPEAIQPELALYFTDEEPVYHPYLVWLTIPELEIPAGRDEHWTHATKTLNQGAYALSIYPHAHLLAREFRIWATLPDGTQRWLIRISDWEFGWQGEYRYVDPIHLPKGTRLDMRIRYDNSIQNPLNPHSPPRRVRQGPNATEEMGDVWIVAVADTEWRPASRHKEKSDPGAAPSAVNQETVDSY